MVGYSRLLGVRILCSYSCPCRSYHNILINTQEENVILCSATFYFYVNGSVILLKMRVLRMDCLVYFRLPASFS